MKKSSSLWRLIFIITLLTSMIVSACSAPSPTDTSGNEEVVATEEEGDVSSEDVSLDLDYEYPEEVLAWAEMIKEEYAGSVINVASATHVSTSAWIAMTPDFEKLTGIDVIWDEAELAQVKDKILLDYSSGNYVYDIFYASNSHSPGYLALGMLEPLKPYFDNEKAIEVPDWYDPDDVILAERLAHSDLYNEQIGVPASGECGIMYYRKDLFDQYNLEYPKTWDDVLELAKFFTEQNIEENGKRVYGIVFRARPSFGGMNWPTAMLTYAFGGDLYDPITKTPHFDEAGNVAMLEYLHELAQYGSPEIPTLSATDALEKYMTGGAAMMFEASALASSVEDPSKSVVAGLTQYAPFPAGPAGEANAVAGASLAISSESKNKDAAWALLLWLTSRANQQIYLDNGGVPTRLSAFEDPALQEEFPWFEATLAGFDQALPWMLEGKFGFPKSPSISAFVDAWAVEGSAAVSGQISAEEACQNIQQKMLEAVAEE